MIDTIFDKLEKGERLTFEDGLSLYQCKELPVLSFMANYVREKKKPGNIVTYIIDRNINYTNVCVDKCSFCAFYRPVGSDEGYVLPYEEIDHKIDELIALEGIQILMQGGLNPKLKIAYYEDLFRHLKTKYPQIWLHCLSAPEIDYIAKVSDLTAEEALIRLKAAGLDSIPGAGAEILVDRVRAEVSRGKCDSERWLNLHRAAHKVGLTTTATMMYGHVETLEERLEHILKIRDLQDESLKNYGRGFTAFIPWNFQPDNVPLGQNPNIRLTTTVEYLQTLAISRIMLDNIENFQVSWVTQGKDVAQLGLNYGANDFGSLMIEENVVSQNNTSFNVTVKDIEKMIADAGYKAKRRNNHYEIIN